MSKVERNNDMGNEARQKKEADEVNLKKAYEDLNDARLREADANLALFEATARKSAVKSDMEEASGLRAKRDSYRAMFQEIKRGAKSDLERLKAALDADWEEMERAMEKFQSKVDKMIAYDQDLWNARLDAMDARIDRMAAKADQFDAETRIRFQNDLAGLRDKQAEARRKVNEFARADEAAGEDLRAGAIAAWNELRAGVESAIKRYR
jgi:hypothetical protein